MSKAQSTETPGTITKVKMQELQSGPEDDQVLHKLNVLERRTRLARKCIGAKIARQNAEGEARRQGYASVAARERARSIEAKRILWERKQYNWNKTQPFGNEGHLAYELDRNILIHKIRELQLPLHYAPHKLMQASNPEEVKGSCLANIRAEVDRKLAKRYTEDITKLRERLEQTQSRLRELLAMRQEEYDLMIIELASLNPDILEDSSGEGKYYRRVLAEDLEKVTAEINPLIEQASKDLECAEEELEADAGKLTHYEWQRQLAVRAYCTTCIQLNVGVSRSVLSSLKEDCLRLKDLMLSDTHLTACGAGLQELEKVEKIELWENNLCDRVGYALSPVFAAKSVRFLHRLVICSNNLGTDGASSLLNELQKASFASCLRYLSLQSNGIGKDDVRTHERFSAELQQAIGNGGLPSLENLDLSNNVLGPRIGRALALLLQNSTSTVKNLILHHTDLGLGSLSKVISSLSSNPTIHMLDLSFAGLTDNHLSQIARMLSNPRTYLTKLFISGNTRISDRGCEVFVRSVASNITLQVLHFENSGYTTKGSKLLISMLNRNTMLEELVFDHSKCLHNPTTNEDSLNYLLYAGMPEDAAFRISNKGRISYTALEAKFVAGSSFYGYEEPPKLTCEKPNTCKGFSVDDCYVGMRCLAPLLGESTPSVLVNVEVIEVILNTHLQRAEAQVRVKLIDFVRTSEDNFEEYDPMKECQSRGLNLKTDFPLIPISQLQDYPPDVAILQLHDAPESFVLFPLQLLPLWLQAPEASGYVRSGIIRNTSQYGAIFLPTKEQSNEKSVDQLKMQGVVHLACPNVSKYWPDQSSFNIKWPRAALSPRPLPAYSRSSSGQVELPPLRSRRSSQTTFQQAFNEIPLQGIAFEFHRELISPTATLRLLQKQTTYPE